MVIDYNNDPKIIDVITFDDADLIMDLEIDAQILCCVLTNNDYFHAISNRYFVWNPFLSTAYPHQ